MSTTKIQVYIIIICATIAINTLIVSIKEIYVSKIENQPQFRVPIPQEYCCPTDSDIRK